MGSLITKIIGLHPKFSVMQYSICNMQYAIWNMQYNNNNNNNNLFHSKYEINHKADHKLITDHLGHIHCGWFVEVFRCFSIFLLFSKNFCINFVTADWCKAEGRCACVYFCMKLYVWLTQSTASNQLHRILALYVTYWGFLYLLHSDSKSGSE